MRALRFLALFCAALVCGLTLTHVLQGPGSRGLDGAGWLSVQHSFYGGFAIVGGTCEIVGLLAAAAVAARLRRAEPAQARAHLVAAICMAGTLVAYVFGNRPVNGKVAAWTAQTLPADWPQYRDRWEMAHAASAALSAIALVALLVVAIWFPPAAAAGRASKGTVASTV
jgi:hypothetical protein